MLKVSKVFDSSVEDPAMYYCNLFQRLFKFIPRYRFEKSAENLSGDGERKSIFALPFRFEKTVFSAIFLFRGLEVRI